MRPYSTARVICTYKCTRSCAGCVNVLHDGGRKIPPIGMAELGRYDEIILTGGEPLLFPGKLIELADHLAPSRLILYTNAPSYAQLSAVAPFFAGVTITLHDNEDAYRYNRKFKKYFGNPDVWDTIPMFYVRIYEAVTIKVELFKTAQYRMCEWRRPEECKMQSNETPFKLRELWV